MHRWVTLVSLVSLVALGGLKPAAAQEEGSDGAESSESTSFEALARSGIQNYKSGDYAKALEFFKRAYEKEQNPDMIYNIARCQEHLGNDQKALETYQKYADHPDVGAEEREDALARVERLEDDEPGGDTGGGESGGGMNTTRTIGWSLVGGGGAALVGGGIFAVLSANSRSAMSDASTLSTAREARSNARTQALVADILFGTAVAAGGTGTVLLLTASKGNEKSSANRGGDRGPVVRVRPLFSNDGLGLSLGAEF